MARTWGGKSAKGYCFFPWIDREEQVRAGTRRAGYHEGKGFLWPRDEVKIVKHLESHEEHDVYWCPMLFEIPRRDRHEAMDEHALWADLDEVDPRTIEDYPPSAAWETSPGRYQAVWNFDIGEALIGASWPGKENQALTYYVGADNSGWDTTQLLRIPGWKNHKVDRIQENGEPPEGRLLWRDGRSYSVEEFRDLPNVEDLRTTQTELTGALEQEIDGVDRADVWSRVKLKLTQRTRELYSAREAEGDRSARLWELERSLADAGCTLAEIVALVRETVWNKHADRADELRVLISEASKAIAQRPEDVVEALEEELEEVDFTLGPLEELIRDAKQPVWIVDGILTEGACGFIAGEPKAFKSWIALDLTLSVATGAHFLNHFRVERPGPVLYIQEEDPLPVIKKRYAQVLENKRADRVKLVDDGVIWEPSELKGNGNAPPVMGAVQQGVVISKESWQIRLDETLEHGWKGEPYRLMIIDTLMMTAGDVEETRAQDMTTKIFKPLKVLARKHNVAIIVVHHMRKSGKDGFQQRGGQLMLGSVANHAWSEDSLYVRRSRKNLIMEFESKSAPEARHKIENINNREWAPVIVENSTDPVGETTHTEPKQPSSSTRVDVLAVIEGAGKPLTARDLVDRTDLTQASAYRALRTLKEQGLIKEQEVGRGRGKSKAYVRAD